MSALGEGKRIARKALQRTYQQHVNRRTARAIAYRPQSDEGKAAWVRFLSQRSSS